MSERRRLLLIAVAACIPHLAMLSNPLLHDAPIAIVNNAAVQSAPIEQLWTHDFWGLDPKTSTTWSGSWRPLVSATWALQARTVGNLPWLYHAGDLAIHAATAVLLAALLVALGSSALVSTIASLLFAWHPVVTEAVASAVGRADMLAVALLLSAALAHIRGRNGLAWLALAASLLCKESAVAGPFVLIALAWGRGEGRTSLRFQAGCVGVLAGYLALRGLTLGGLGAVPMIQVTDNPLVEAGLPVRAANAAALFALAGRLLVLPYGLNHLYSAGTLPLLPSFAAPSASVGLGLFALLVGLAIVACRRAVTLLVFGAAMVVLPLLPALHLITPSGVLFAERWLYAAATGVAALLAWILAAIPLRAWKATVAVAIAMAVVFAGLSVRRDLEWRSMETLIASSLRAYPGTAKVWNERGISALNAGHTADAVRAFEEAVRLVPADPRPWYGLAGARERAGDIEGAERAWRGLLELAPPNAGALWVRFAQWQWKFGRRAAARATLEEASTRFPGDVTVRQALESIPPEPR